MVRVLGSTTSPIRRNGRREVHARVGFDVQIAELPVLDEGQIPFIEIRRRPAAIQIGHGEKT